MVKNMSTGTLGGDYDIFMAEFWLNLIMIWFLVLILVLVWSFWSRYSWMHIFLRQGVPGPQPNIIFGTTDFRKGILEGVRHLRENYGRTFSVCLGSQPTLMTVDPELLQLIMVTNFDSFRNRTLARTGGGILKYNLLSLRDNDWRRVRGVLSPTFSTSKLKLMSHTILRRCDQLMKAIKTEADKDGTVDFYGLFQRLTLDVILECAFAMEVNSIAKYKETKPMLQSLKMLLRPATRGYQHLFPTLSWLVSFLLPSFLFSSANNAQVVAKLLKYCKKAIKDRRDTGDRKIDTLQFMLDSMNEQNKKHITEEEVLANTFVFLVAGYETTSTALSFTAYLLALHPQVQEKLYKEVSKFVDNENDMGFDTVRKLRYLDQVWNESLRLYPPAAGLLGREAASEVRLKTVTVPAGSWVMTSPILLHRDPDYWPDPLAFRPERWAPENRNLIHPMAYIPFGEGPRHCIGKRFAEMEAKLALVKIVNEFKLEATKKTEAHPMNIKQSGLTMYPAKESIYLRIVERKKL